MCAVDNFRENVWCTCVYMFIVCMCMCILWMFSDKVYDDMSVSLAKFNHSLIATECVSEALQVQICFLSTALEYTCLRNLFAHTARNVFLYVV